MLELFIKKPSGGFATHKYKAGYCVLPDPADPLATYRHAKAMTDEDPLLPMCKIYLDSVDYFRDDNTNAPKFKT